MNVGHQIRIYRKELNLSQVELADKIYVSSQTISNWENKRSYPDLHNLIALTSLFNVSLDELVKGDVVEMKNAVGKDEMTKYTWMMLGFILLSIISMGAALKFSDSWFGWLIPLILWMISMYFAIKIEKLKNKYNVQTYKEILDYMENGYQVNQKSRNNKKYFIEKTIIVAAFTAIIGLLGILSLYLFGEL
ncbi:helix-turn-helix domain-containing protein [Macrococcus lamae]|uniref:XRE family transcriptional regulator n=1 Tax=Macrococcus lamae TaxID=198484 RepID=A0A4R6BXE0_9STAP|nr:helix-turn-helix transcriptional regulator [Macrococcus lamae]TDM12885.1 XRE family transcriptional regulator [Macrococcus lamae]